MIDKQAILAEILEYSQVKEPEIPDGCITYQDIEAELGCKHAKAQRVMAGLVAEGKFERVELGGRVKVVFRRKDDA